MTVSETGREIPADELVERLRNAAVTDGPLGRRYADHWQMMLAAAARIASLEAERARTVEECARVADDHARAWGIAMATPAIVIADAIRALASEKGGQADG